jgi:hypothetical protein
MLEINNKINKIMIIIREKSYADNNEKSGISTGAKVGLGALGTVATGALAFAGARRGMLGRTVAVKTNQAWGNLGKSIGSKGMMKDASKRIGDTKTSEAIAMGMTKKEANAIGKQAKDLTKNTWNSGGTIGSSGTNVFAKPVEEAAKAAK